MKYAWTDMTNEHAGWMAGRKQEQAKIGHLRGDFGRDGNEFWTSWFDWRPEMKTTEFRDELQQVVNDARTGIIKNFRSICKHTGTDLSPWYGRPCYGSELETKEYLYLLRTIPTQGDYNLYLYCFKKSEVKA